MDSSLKLEEFSANVQSYALENPNIARGLSMAASLIVFIGTIYVYNQVRHEPVNFEIARSLASSVHFGICGLLGIDPFGSLAVEPTRLSKVDQEKFCTAIKNLSKAENWDEN